MSGVHESEYGLFGEVVIDSGISQHCGLEDALRPEQRHSSTVVHEAFGQDRAWQHLTMDVHLCPQPLERRQSNPMVNLAHESDGKPWVRAGGHDPAVPTLHREAGYAFRFRAIDQDEPPHVHVEGNGGSAKFWLSGVRLERSAGYNRRQLKQVARIVEAHADEFEARWHDYFD